MDKQTKVLIGMVIIEVAVFAMVLIMIYGGAR